MPTLPWKRLAEVDPGREYLMYASMLPLRSLRPHMGTHKAVVWRARGTEIPIRFGEGHDRLEELPQWQPEQVPAAGDGAV